MSGEFTESHIYSNVSVEGIATSIVAVRVALVTLYATVIDHIHCDLFIF